jgi:hypothetical protein
MMGMLVQRLSSGEMVMQTEHSNVTSAQQTITVTDAYIFSVFYIEVLIIRYDKIVSHMIPTCAIIFIIEAHDPGKDLPHHHIRHVYVMIGWNVM